MSYFIRNDTVSNNRIIFHYKDRLQRFSPYLDQPCMDFLENRRDLNGQSLIALRTVDQIAWSWETENDIKPVFLIRDHLPPTLDRSVLKFIGVSPFESN